MNDARYAEGMIISHSAFIIVARLRRDRREPVVVFLRFSGHRLEECFLDASRDRAAFALAYDSAIQLTYRRYFGCGSSKEGFICDVQIIARDAPGRYRIANSGGEGVAWVGGESV